MEATQQRIERLPYGVGHLTSGWFRVVAIAAVVFLVGVVAYIRQFTGGEIVTGLRDIGTMGGAPWGLYVGFIVYFVGVSFAGIVLAAVIRLLDLRHLKPVARMAEVLTVTALILAAFTILSDVGQPLRAIVNLARYARPGSPFFGTFSLVISGYLFASLVYLYLDGRRDAAICARVPGRLQRFHRWWAAGYRDTPAERKRHRRASFWLSIAILPLLVTAHSTLGFVFGLQVGRPGWHSALQAPGFVVLAGVSGVGLLIVVAAALRRALGEEQRLGVDILRWLGNLLMVLIVIYLYFIVVELLTSVYQGTDREVRVTNALLTGDYAWLYWLSLACLAGSFVLLARQYFKPHYSVHAAVVAGLLVNLAAIGKRFLIVVPSQTHGTLLPYKIGSYSPSWVEYGVIMGLFALGVLLYSIFMKVFPIMELPEADEQKPTSEIGVAHE